MIQELKDLYAICFEDSQEYIDYFFREKYRRSNTVVAYADNRIISVLFLINKKVNIRGITLSCPYVVAACTHPDYRKLGIMHSLLYDAFTRLISRGSAISALFPFRHSFYNKQGYVTISRVSPIEQINNQLDVRQANYEDISIIHNLYTEEMKKYDCFLVRDIEETLRKLQEVSNIPGKTMLFLDNGKPCGYIMFDNSEIIENIGKVSLINDVGNMRLITPDDNGEEFTMMRIVNPIKLLSRIKYPSDICSNINIRIVDEFFPDNNCIINLNISNKKAQIQSSHDYQHTLTIEQVTHLVFGSYEREGYNPSEILRKIFPPLNTLIFDKY